MDHHVEPRVRRLVAEYLGVELEQLSPEISLIEDLAADSLDLVELSLALESEFGVAMPETILDDVRTYADLVDATVRVTGERLRHDARRAYPPALIRARVVPPNGDASTLERAVGLTPYEAQEIAEDALRAGRGARLDVTMPATASDASLARVQEEFAWLGPRGIQVTVHRDYQPGAPRQTSAA
jgi:acyl carrier protein